jgi:hypothetical protein
MMGRPRLSGKSIHITLRLRQGRSPQEDRLIERLERLGKGQQSRFLRAVLTTGDIEPILDAELAQETGRVTAALDAMAMMWNGDDDG